MCDSVKRLGSVDRSTVVDCDVCVFAVRPILACPALVHCCCLPCRNLSAMSNTSVLLFASSFCQVQVHNVMACVGFHFYSYLWNCVKDDVEKFRLVSEGCTV